MVLFRTEFNGYAVKFSPFEEDKIAVATAQNFGIVGNGKQYVLQVTPQGLIPVSMFYSKDCLYDCAWSEEHEAHLVSVSGDGSIKLWDVSKKDGRPIRAWQEHTQEVYGVDWNLQRKDSFVTASWDKSVKLWSPLQPRSLRTWMEHEYVVYSAMWDPLHPDVFASCSGDCTLKVWDTRGPQSVQTIRAHDMEVLTMDWNKYMEHVVFTGSVDRTIRMWDLRNPGRPLGEFSGHAYAVRKN